MANDLLTHYLPNPEEIPPEVIIDGRERLAGYLNQWWPELDTRPNSPFGDLHLTPLATLMVSLERALRRRDNDLNLANIAQGRIVSEDFARQYIRNFGLATRDEVPATGIVELEFRANRQYQIDPQTLFAFGQSVFKINPSEGSPVTIYPTASGEGRHVLVNRGNQRFVVQLPVTGESGQVINKGDTANHNLQIDDLQSVTAAADFDPGTPPESLPQLADKALRTFASPDLSSPAGAVSFLWRSYPNLVGASAVLSGHKEMLRDGTNILGINEGAMDLHVRSRKDYVEGQWRVTLTYDNSEGLWQGRINTPHVPVFFALSGGVFQVAYYQDKGSVNKVYSRSAHGDIDNVGLSYSHDEELGIRIEDDSPSDFEPNVISSVQSDFTDGSGMNISGEYNGYVFQSFPERSIEMRFGSSTDKDGYPSVRAHVQDHLNGETGTVLFVANAKTGATVASIDKDATYQRLFNGLELNFHPATGHFNPDQVAGFRYQFSIKGKTATFGINYLYDPAIRQVDSAINNPDNRPPGASLLARGFLAGYVISFDVHYRARYAQRVDETTARQEIYDYINGLAWPEVYESSRIGEILTRNGATGVQSIQPDCLFYPSLADVYVDKNGNEQTVPRWRGGSMTPPRNDFGLGERNVGYVLPLNNIRLHGFNL